MDKGRKHHSKKQLFLPPPSPPGQHCREAENTVKHSTKCTFSSVSAREHPVGGNNKVKRRLSTLSHCVSYQTVPLLYAKDWPQTKLAKWPKTRMI